MLTLDSEQIARQRQISRFREQQHRNRENLLDSIERKTITVAPDGDICTTDLESQLGLPLSGTEFIRRLQIMNRNLLFEVSQSDNSKTGIYVIRNQQKVFICGMERGFMPERTVKHAKREKVPNPDEKHKGEFIEVETFTKETRGWRTVLMRLLRARLITAPQIDQYFPPNLNSRNWKMLTT